MGGFVKCCEVKTTAVCEAEVCTVGGLNGR